MTFNAKPPHYRTLLLTFWAERNQDQNSQPVWRFRLEDPHTGQRFGFANLEALVAGLEQRMTDLAIKTEKSSED